MSNGIVSPDGSIIQMTSSAMPAPSRETDTAPVTDITNMTRSMSQLQFHLKFSEYPTLEFAVL